MTSITCASFASYCKRECVVLADTRLHDRRTVDGVGLKSTLKIGFVTTGIALQALNGTGAWAARRPTQSMRVIFPMYDTPFQFLVLQDSNIRSLAEMAEKHIGIGPRGGTAGVYVPEFFKVLKLSAHFTYGEWVDLAAQFQS